MSVRVQRTVWWLSPGDPDQRTGGYLYNARVVAELRALGHRVEVLPVEGRWPFPGVDDPAVLGPIPDDAIVVADGLLWPGLGPHGAALAARTRVYVLVHSLLGRETGLTADAATAADTAERAALGYATGLVATSAATARALGVPAAVVIPGTNPAARARGGRGRDVLTVGTLTRRKRHDVLLDALSAATVPWTLTCAGAARDEAWARSLAQRVDSDGLADRVVFAGDLDGPALDRLYAAADVVVQPAAYEAFGMAIAEAVARGLPVLTTPAGVLEHLPEGAVVTVDDRTIGATLETLLRDPDARRAQADRAWAAAASLPTWTTQAALLASVLGATS